VTTEEQKQEPELLLYQYPRTAHYWHALGYQSAVIEGFKQGRILANKCPKCGRAMVPARTVCPECYVEATEWVDQGQRGRLVAAFKLGYPFYDRRTGEAKIWDKPIVAVELEGGARLDGWCSETDLEKLKPGLLLEAVWRPPEERIGAFDDILHWKPVEE
jgi:uncharacterized OB-fold protein